MITVNEAVTDGTQLLFGGVVSRIRPHRQLIGLPSFANPNTQWGTIVDDRNPTAGPGSFDVETLKWWATRADIIVVDAADRHREKSKLLGRAAADGHRLFVLETVEGQREAWHQVLRAVTAVGSRPMVMEFRNGSTPGVLHYSSGLLGADFSDDPPPFTPTS
jgi:hypothetical protein